MSQLPIKDAGPGVNSFSINRERLLFSAFGPFANSLAGDSLRRRNR